MPLRSAILPRKLPSWLFGLLVVALLGTQIAGQSHALGAELHDPSCSLCHSVSDAELPSPPPAEVPLQPQSDVFLAAAVPMGECAPLDSYVIRAPPQFS